MSETDFFKEALGVSRPYMVQFPEISGAKPY